MTNGIYFGIDFGTTNSSMAFYDPRRGDEARVLRNAEKEYETPSVVYFGEDEILVGKAAEEKLEEVKHSLDPMERNAVALRLERNIKRNLLKPIIVVPGRKPMRPAEVVALILGKLKRDAEKEHFYDTLGRVVLTFPATFGKRERDVLRQAAEEVGFGTVELLEEPTAAAIAVSRLGQKVGKGILVYDLGAGTFDLSVVARDEDGTFRVAMEPQGDPHCGGNDLDLALYGHCDRIAQEELGRPISLTDVPDQAFLQQCRKRKENLSLMKKSRFSSYLPSKSGVQQFKHEVDQKTFEGLIRDRIDGTVRTTASLLDEARVRGHEVDAVVLIGGSSRVPLVERMLQERLPVEVRSFSEKDYAVALGAAYHAYDLWKPPSEPEPYSRRKPGREETAKREVLNPAPSGWRQALARQQEAPGTVEQAARDHDALYKKGVELHGQGRYQKALEAFDEASKIMPNDHRAWLEKGRVLYRLGRYPEALEAFDQATSIVPGDPEAWRNKGLASYRLGRYEEALDAFDKTIKISSDDRDAWQHKGETLARLGRHQEALVAYGLAKGHGSEPGARGTL